jgi:hypothetical protein
MYTFFAITPFKVIIALLIILVSFIGPLMYGRSVEISPDGAIDASGVSLGVQLLYGASNVLLVPVRAINAPSNPAAFTFLFLLPLTAQAYIISCAVSWSIDACKKKEGMSPHV